MLMLMLMLILDRIWQSSCVVWRGSSLIGYYLFRQLEL